MLRVSTRLRPRPNELRSTSPILQLVNWRLRGRARPENALLEIVPISTFLKMMLKPEPAPLVLARLKLGMTGILVSSTITDESLLSPARSGALLLGSLSSPTPMMARARSLWKGERGWWRVRLVQLVMVRLYRSLGRRSEVAMVSSCECITIIIIII